MKRRRPFSTREALNRIQDLIVNRFDVDAKLTKIEALDLLQDIANVLDEYDGVRQ